MIDNERAKEMVDDLYEINEDDLTTWEIDFTCNMKDKSEFTDNELNKIEELWRKHCE